MFDEATRVPLLIAHPLSPYKGQHYREPVELVDLFPTVMDLVAPPVDRRALQGLHLERGHKQRLQRPGGKSLAPVVLGSGFALGPWRTGRVLSSASATATAATATSATAAAAPPLSAVDAHSAPMPVLAQTFAISQAWKCAIKAMSHLDPRAFEHMRRHKLWYDCDIRNHTQAETSVMGYSMRTSAYRCVGVCAGQD